jgi:hypothetical protein
LELIDLLSELCDAVPWPLCSLSYIGRQKSKRFLEDFEWRIRNLRHLALFPNDEQSLLILELYKLAMLVYLHRVTAGQLKQTVSVHTQTDRALEILVQLGSCE